MSCFYPYFTGILYLIGENATTDNLQTTFINPLFQVVFIGYLSWSYFVMGLSGLNVLKYKNLVGIFKA